MVRVSAVVFTAILCVGQSFAPVPTFQRNAAISSTIQPSTTTSLEAAPTMFIYWSIKTAIDTIAYGLGATDEVKGTGVWNQFQLKRDKEEEDDEEE